MKTRPSNSIIMKIVLYLMILTLSCHVSYSFPKTKIFGSFHQRRNLLLMTLNQPSNFKPLHSFRKILSTTLISSSANVIPTAAIFDIKPKSSIETVATNTRLKIKNSIQDKLKGMQGQSEERQRASVSGHAIAATTTRGSSFVRDAVRSVGPSVVRIDCEKEISSMMALLAPESPLKEGDVVKISGSGFVVTEDGYILTNAHVVQSTRRITVTFSNGRTFKATLVACDELTDLAVLRAETGETKLTKAPLGDSSRLQSGDWLIAVGCPVGLDFTVTLGIVSSPHRSAAEVGASHLKGTYIQTDAALNSGNSGGPLLNDAGEVIGINTMVRSNTEAIGFAIPINRAREAFDVLKEGKKPTHAYFGMELHGLTPDNARIHNDDPNSQRLPISHGALVTRVMPGSPAASVFRKFDVITEINGQLVRNVAEADFHLDRARIGSACSIKVLRGEMGSKLELSVIPLDLMTLIEEKKSKRMMAFMRPQ